MLEIDIDIAISKAKEDLSTLKLTLNAIKNDPSIQEWISVLFLYQDLIQNCEKCLAIFDNSISNVNYISKIVQGMIDTCLEIMLNCKDGNYRQDCIPYTEIQRQKVLDCLIKSHKREEKIKKLIKSNPNSTKDEAGTNNSKATALNRSFSEKEAAHYINMSVGFLRKSRCKGNADNISSPPYLKIGKTIRYLKKDLDTWLEVLSQRQTY